MDRAALWALEKLLLKWLLVALPLLQVAEFSLPVSLLLLLLLLQLDTGSVAGGGGGGGGGASVDGATNGLYGPDPYWLYIPYPNGAHMYGEYCCTGC
jgi:hypothetical protein